MKTENGIELKPCPFCGGKARMRVYGIAYGTAVDVQCSSCGVLTEPFEDERSFTLAEEKAAAVWNRRVAHAD